MVATFAVVTVGLVAGLALLAGRLWRVSRDVVRLRAAVGDRVAVPVRIGERMRQADETVARMARHQREVDQRLDAVEQWVRYWAKQAER